MHANFKAALEHVLKHEGGYVDHPQDPGGATNKGVTLATFRRHFGSDKSKADLKKITSSQVEKVYQTGYWNASKCDDLPSGVDYAVFDASVNSGPGRGARWLQAAVGAQQDGSIGPKTLARVKEHSPVDIINNMCDTRMAYLRGLRHWPTFGRGWTRRVEGVRSAAIAMAEGTSKKKPEPEKPTVDFRTTKKGSRGEWVRKLQAALGIVVDGRFGPKTDAAVRAYQERHGLAVDGIAGRMTYRSLGLIP